VGSGLSDSVADGDTAAADAICVEDCRTRASRPPQTHCRYKAVDGPSSRYIA
jgi:hypothetical protein